MKEWNEKYDPIIDIKTELKEIEDNL